MHRLGVVLLIASFTLSGDAAAPARGRLPLQVLASSDGLPNDSITAFHTDSRGYLWIGTLDGLSRYDGSRFVNYTTDDGLGDRMIWAIDEDRHGTVWIATSGELTAIAPDATRGSSLFRRFGLPKEAVGGSIASLLVDRNGTAWAGCGYDLCRVKGSRLEIDPTFPSSRAPVLRLAEGPDGSLWVGTSRALYRRREGKWKHYDVDVSDDSREIGGLLVDSGNRVWVSFAYGVIVFTPEETGSQERTLRQLAGNPVLPGGAFALPSEGEAVAVETSTPTPIICRTPFQSRDDTVWVPCYDGIFRIAGSSVEFFDTADGLPLDLTAAGEDPAGRLWIGTRGRGAFRLVRSGARTFGLEHGLANERIMSLFAYDDQTICATNRLGLSCIANGVMHHASLWPPGVKIRGWGWNQIVAQHSDGTLWFATGEGLVRWPRLKRIEDFGADAPLAVYRKQHGLDSDDVFRVWIDSRGIVWASTFGQKPLSRGDPSTGVFESFSPDAGFPHAAPTAFAEDRAGNVWIGFYTGGLVRYADGHFETLEANLPDGFVRDLMIDSKGGLWIGTTEGVARIVDPTADIGSLESKQYSRADGLPGDGGYCFVEMPDGGVGIGSHRGFVILDPDSGSTEPVTVREGLPSNEVTVAMVDRSGGLWLGTIRGIAHLTTVPKPLRSPPRQPRIHSVTIDGIALSVPELGSTSLEGIRIEYPSRQLGLGFSVPQFDRSAPARIEYRLNDSESWSASSAQGILVFDRLPVGVGSLELRAVLRNGQTSPPATISFEVIPAIWRRAWFIALTVLLAAALIVIAHRRSVAHAVALERMRTRVATDLHDDLGSSLSRISILSEAAKLKLRSNDAEPILDEIAGSARGLVDVLGDAIWSIDPRRDDVRSLMLRVRQFAAPLSDARSTSLDFEISEAASRIPLTPEQRREGYLLLKEAINNSIRHASASSLALKADVMGRHVIISVMDDGDGIVLPASRNDDGGRGLTSMHTRAERAGGRLEVVSRPGGGTRISLLLPVQ